jgi:hypothetical protein
MPGTSPELLAESYGRSLALFTELNPSPLLRFDRHGRIQLANPAANAAFSSDNLIGEQLGDHVPGLPVQALSELIDGGASRRMEWRAPRGAYYMLELRGIPELGAGVLYGFDISELKAAESQLERQRQRLQRHNAALMRLAHDHSLFAGDNDVAAAHITRSAAETLGVARASIWLLRPDNSGIVLLDLYQIDRDEHSAGMHLEAADYLDYFAAIHTERSLVANDARTHPATRCFRDSYLDPLGITSMLDVPVRRGAHSSGVLCCEHIGPAREWTVDEVNFAASLAALFSQAMEISLRPA